MPRLTKSLPKYRKHKASGQAVVTLAGTDHYLGPHNSKTSRLEYDRLVGQWQQNGRRLPASDNQPEITIAELLAGYLEFARAYYVKNGRQTATIYGIRATLKLVRRNYGNALVSEFGPLAIKFLQAQLIETGASRRYINDHTGRIKRIFKWGVANEMISIAVYQRLTAVDGLRRGRTDARETPPILPVKDDIVEKTLGHLPPVVADMVRFQGLTGCRPGEVCIIRPCDVDMTGDVWSWKLSAHKTEHRGRDRIVAIGPRAQDVLRRYLLRDDQTFCFSPKDSERLRRQDLQQQRKTPAKYGNRPGTNRKRRPKRTAGDRYTTNSYRHAIHRGCDKAFPPDSELSNEELQAWQKSHRWSPNQLRHSAGTNVRKQFGLEGAQVVLGHSNAGVTQIYAERDFAKAAEIMRQVG